MFTPPGLRHGARARSGGLLGGQASAGGRSSLRGEGALTPSTQEERKACD